MITVFGSPNRLDLGRRGLITCSIAFSLVFVSVLVFFSFFFVSSSKSSTYCFRNRTINTDYLKGITSSVFSLSFSAHSVSASVLSASSTSLFSSFAWSFDPSSSLSRPLSRFERLDFLCFFLEDFFFFFRCFLRCARSESSDEEDDDDDDKEIEEDRSRRRFEP